MCRGEIGIFLAYKVGEEWKYPRIQGRSNSNLREVVLFIKRMKGGGKRKRERERGGGEREKRENLFVPHPMMTRYTFFFLQGKKRRNDFGHLPSHFREM